MRLIALSLQHYGNFRSETLAFDPAPGVVNLIVAPNGAGKSVLRSAFCDLLFGIGGQTPMGFRYGYAGMRIGAEA
ncbi:MAG: AAA family ATPase, partial [Acetobacteraceae bacterium]